ncbi:hypothetical protein PHAMO_230042 [Magnetospirillum molischianum DSM 120]|uniref:Uncharacterized protein n=1 Tax=Magnetospirillum molischianum DSM 120 TaxID=1150626 RepID=H8FRR2_MAGML|nr:hypothetical protein PHAMO_230042 [Magnetospirillum molischianum DSM 120]
MRIAVDKSGPFTHAPTSVSRTMTLVLAALLPATLYDIWLFGWPAALMFLVTVLSCVGLDGFVPCLVQAPRWPHPCRWFGGSDRLVAGDEHAAVGSVVGVFRRCGFRDLPRQACLWRSRSKCVQPGDGRSYRGAGVVSAPDDHLRQAGAAGQRRFTRTAR